MKSKLLIKIFTALLIALFGSASYAHDIDIHVSDKWKECAMQLDPSLTQSAWHQFTQEAGIMAVFNSLTSAKPLGKWNFELGLTVSQYPIDDKSAAWNDTFVHPYANHWLYGDDARDQVAKDHSESLHALRLPLMIGRIGITERMDVGLFFFSDS
jgi:hypothetical protein